jgi:hypothetical protein
VATVAVSGLGGSATQPASKAVIATPATTRRGNLGNFDIISPAKLVAQAKSAPFFHHKTAEQDLQKNSQPAVIPALKNALLWMKDDVKAKFSSACHPINGCLE